MIAKFIIYRDVSGQYRWRLEANNSKIIAVCGESFVSKQWALQSVALVRRLSQIALIVDRTTR